MRRTVDCEQRSLEWHTVRMGRFTASRMADLSARLKIKSKGRLPGEPTADCLNYQAEIIAERTTGQITSRWRSPEMLYGQENEGLARRAYERATGRMAELVGFTFHPRMDFSGASPDGLTGRRRGIEIKVPKSETHIKYLIEGVCPEEYYDQCQWTAECEDLEVVDFFSFDPRQDDPELAKFLVEVERDQKRIDELIDYTMRMEAEVQVVIQRIKGEKGAARYQLPPIESFLRGNFGTRPLSTDMVRVGDIEVPADVMAVLDQSGEFIP